MRRLVAYRLGDEEGQTVLVEVDEPTQEASGEETAAFKSWREPEEAEQTLDEALENVKPAADILLSKLGELAVRPDETMIAFGVKLTVKSGAVLASAGVEANFNVTLTWRDNTAAGG